MEKSLLHKKSRSELVRKGIHLLIAFVPALAELHFSNTALLLMAGTLFYSCLESLRFLGFSPPLVSTVTKAVLRKREEDRFALAPVTLGLGALLSILLFPPQITKVAIYTLAFGDSASSIIGKYLGRLRPAFLSGKSIEGILSCFAVSALACFCVLHDWKCALAVGFASLLVDIFPLKELDNIALPVAAGLAAGLF